MIPTMTINSETGSEPITTAEAKAWALIDTDADDDEIGTLITTARRMVESYINKDILAKERTYFLPIVYDNIVSLPYRPVASIDEVIVGTTTYTSSQYTVTGISNDFIDLGLEAENVKITYTTSGLTANQQVKDAIKAIVEYLYNSQGVIEETDLPNKMPKHIKKMLIGNKNIYI